MADKKKDSEHMERDSNSESYENDRHSQNARAAAALEEGIPNTPRINTDPL